MKHKLVGFGICAAASHVQAQPFVMEQSVIAGGGGAMSGGAFTLVGTIGQAEAGGAMSGGAYTLTGGFWPGRNDGPQRLCADQNNDGLVNPADFSAWIANFNAGDLRADTNQDGHITPADFSAWIAAFNAGMNGPVCPN